MELTGPVCLPSPWFVKSGREKSRRFLHTILFIAFDCTILILLPLPPQLIQIFGGKSAIQFLSNGVATEFIPFRR